MDDTCIPSFYRRESYDFSHERLQEDGEYFSGNVVCGINTEIIRDLHCGYYLSGVGTVIDYEFNGADIDKMKRHFAEWTEKQNKIKAEKEAKEKAYEEEKKKMLEGVTWDIQKHTTIDEDGKVPYYTHTITINGQTFEFAERNIFDFGRVINPCYSVMPGMEPGGLMLKRDGRYFWSGPTPEPAREVSGAELKAYNIISKYGKFANSGIRM